MKVFGQHDPGTIAQLSTVAEHAEKVALMADGHVGYVMPIGGVAAYRDQVSVVGVGFDVACLPAGTPVTTHDGYHRPIEEITPADAATCWDGERVRRVHPHLGAIPRGTRPVMELTLTNRRTIRATADHQILTKAGWKPAGTLASADAIACSPYVGLPHIHQDHEIPLALRDAGVEAELSAKGLYPLHADNPRLPALLRLLGYASGDGHLSRDGKRVSVYVFDEQDAARIREDFCRVGYEPRMHRRQKKETYREEIHLYVNSVALHSLFAALGSPVGKKDWPEFPMPWLFEVAPWVRAQFLSAFCSAEMMTPRVHRNGTVPNLQLKQSGNHLNAIRFFAALLQSLDFEVSVAPSGVQRGSRTTSVLQILGGQEAQLRFLRDVGFCHSISKRIRAATVASVAWQGDQYVRNREAAKQEARTLKRAGVGWQAVTGDVSERFGVSQGFVYHAIYGERGKSRRLPGKAVVPDTTGEICWVPVERVSARDPVPVYDVVTGDPAHCFFASGVVAHNCGNAAIRTDLTVEGLAGNPKRRGRELQTLADRIAANISFGVGRKNQSDDAPTDHPLFEDPAWSALPPSERNALKQKARAQLGTVGSGNHYVDVFADETGTLWVGVHFGSRGFGHTVASGFLSLGQGRGWQERVPEREVLLSRTSPLATTIGI